MNLGGVGAFAGGLAGGYFEGQNQKRLNTLSGLATQKGAREQSAFDRSVSNAQKVGARLRELGYHDLASSIDSSAVATDPGTNNAGASDMGGIDNPAVNGMTVQPYNKD